MFLKQKNVEATCLDWIQIACMFMVDEVYERTLDSLADKRSVKAVIEGQQDEWKVVCFPPFQHGKHCFLSGPCRPIGMLMLILRLLCSYVLYGVERGFSSEASAEIFFACA
jgi:hypothetical protein